ncbi:hypothetical protein OIU74_008321 [Salix koriyanagi]|uniref:Uncharacterized protein n=1 Tax=Salix koriyanagi TaxID=2511006 RepID=A0A9Q0U5X2_9ROSI|nr:hypothetical protein OIU74_008321 [Salix koriyanagi]
MDDDTRRVLVQVPQKLNRPILVFCVSGSYPDTRVMEKDISGLVNMYRFIYFGDFAAANKIGAKGLLGRSWPRLGYARP